MGNKKQHGIHVIHPVCLRSQIPVVAWRIFVGSLLNLNIKSPKQNIKCLVFILMILNCTILFWHSLVNNTAKILSKCQYCVKFSSCIWNLKIMHFRMNVESDRELWSWNKILGPNVFFAVLQLKRVDIRRRVCLLQGLHRL